MDTQTTDEQTSDDGPVLILQADTELVIHDHDLDLLATIAQESREMMFPASGWVETGLPSPLKKICLVALKHKGWARRFAKMAAGVVVKSGRCVKLDPRGYDDYAEIEKAVDERVRPKL